MPQSADGGLRFPLQTAQLTNDVIIIYPPLSKRAGNQCRLFSLCYFVTIQSHAKLLAVNACIQTA